MSEYLVIATWSFGMTAVKKAALLLEGGKPAFDAVIAGAQAVEDDPKVNSVGYGGIANSIGTVQLDACVMEGRTLNCGAVAGVENIRHAAALARRVMEKTAHVLLVGEGARLFAVQQGFPLETLNTPESIAEWERQHKQRQNRPLDHPPMPSDPGHDTIAVIARDQAGSLTGVCTTAGLPLKLPGRVGDSPLIGHGLYVDDRAGAAAGTGVGEEVIRIGGSMHIVEAMRAGQSAQQACEGAVRRVNEAAVRRGVHPAKVAFIAIDCQGRAGAACTEQTNFQYAVARPGKAELLKAPELGVH
jgi:N4-(beta-N-acetylglucosaminyl)-L-asparaginase